MFNLFRLCRQDEISFDIVAEAGNIVAKNGDNVEATFNFFIFSLCICFFCIIATVIGEIKKYKEQIFTINSFDIVAVLGRSAWIPQITTDHGFKDTGTKQETSARKIRSRMMLTNAMMEVKKYSN